MSAISIFKEHVGMGRGYIPPLFGTGGWFIGSSPQNFHEVTTNNNKRIICAKTGGNLVSLNIWA